MSIKDETSVHLDEVQLHEFASNPRRDGLSKQRQHLLNCDECRSKLSQLQMAERIVHRHLETISLNSKSTELKSRLHQITHEQAMIDGLQMDHNSTANHNSTETRSKFWSTLRSLFDLQNRVSFPVAAIPATAVVAVFAVWITSSVNLGKNHEGSADIYAFQDSSSIVFSQARSKPGLGFFHGSNKEDRTLDNYSGFEIESNTSDTSITIRWAPVEGVKTYELQLFEISKNVRQKLHQGTTNDTYLTIDRTLVQTGQLYRLSLFGKTSDGYHFEHTGGFILR